MFTNLLPNVKLTKLTDPTATGTTTIVSGIVDMQGFESVVFFTSLGTAATNNGMKVQQGADSGGSDLADLAGSLQTSGSSDEDLAVEIIKPRERYLACAIVRGTTTTIGDIWAIQAGPRVGARDNSVSGTIAVKSLASPEEGTA